MNNAQAGSPDCFVINSILRQRIVSYFFFLHGFKIMLHFRIKHLLGDAPTCGVQVPLPVIIVSKFWSDFEELLQPRDQR